MGWTLADIRRKVRQVTGRYSSTTLSNQRLDQAINNYYVYKLPNDLKLEREHTYYEFYTEADEQNYEYPLGFVNFEGPMWLDGYMLLFYEDPTVWYNQNPLQIARYSVGTGDGVTSAYTFTVNPSIVPGSCVITDNTLTAYDDSAGSWTGDASSGSIGYTTGSISITFSTPPADGATISFSWQPYIAARPYSVLLYNNMFKFYPIPDTVYRARIKAYRLEEEMTSASDTPRQIEWGPCIAYGASLDIVSDFGEMDKYAEIETLYKAECALIMRRTHQNLLNQRARPMF
jgi:hypothetical protein